jgi:hypothetical protein
MLVRYISFSDADHRATGVYIDGLKCYFSVGAIWVVDVDPNGISLLSVAHHLVPGSRRVLDVPQAKDGGTSLIDLPL